MTLIFKSVFRPQDEITEKNRKKISILKNNELKTFGLKKSQESF